MKKKKVKAKKSVRRSAAKRKKAVRPAKKKVPKKSPPKITKKPKISYGELVGKVTHYFPHVQAAVVKVKTAKLRIGDHLHFKGHTTDFKLPLTSMQVDHDPIQEARKGAEIGVQVPARVREGDSVYRTK